ncbi:MAG: class I adenylate-forming enzyme family protein [Propionibacteriaceae bacterium]
MPQEQLSDDAVASPPAQPDPLVSVTNLADLVTYQANVRPHGVALVKPAPERQALTWSELETQVSAVAAGLAAHGLVAGHRVALHGPNSVEFVVAYFAALRAGFVCVPLNPDATADELQTMLHDSGARAVLSAGEVDVAGVRVLPLTPAGLAALAADGVGPVLSPPDREALAVLLYTAGTSGDPKAAMLTHRALLSHLEHLASFAIADSDTVVLALLPLFHVFGLNAVLGTWVLAGATLVVEDGPDDMLRIIAEEHVTNLPVAPSILFRLLQHDDLAAQLTGVQTVVSGAAPLTSSLESAFTERTGIRIEQGYGLTEAAPGVTVTFGTKISGPGHVGRALPGVELRIGDGSDEAEPAEIWIRGQNLFSGYWPDGHGGPDADGWFATGDIGYLEAGELFLVDRARELIIVNGFNVYPAEVENVIREVPGVDAVAVIGRPHERTGEQVVAFVAGTGISDEQIMDHCTERLARFKRPAEVFEVSELPRGATGKIKKGALRQLMSTPRGPLLTSDQGTNAHGHGE